MIMYIWCVGNMCMVLICREERESEEENEKNKKCGPMGKGEIHYKVRQT